MDSFTNLLKAAPDFASRGPAPEADIENAQLELGLRFSDEYLDYVRQCGVASADGHEFTGVCPFPRLDVVHVTQEQRALHTGIPGNLYVIEELGMDDIVAWQGESGEIWLSQPGSAPMRTAASLAEYFSDKE